jgi:transcriptional regulator with XRE-family HTH domain
VSSLPDEIETAAQLASALTFLRARQNLTVRDVARLTGIPASTLGGYFAARNLPPATREDDLDSVLAALEVHADEFEAWRRALRRARGTRGIPRQR